MDIISRKKINIARSRRQGIEKQFQRRLKIGTVKSFQLCKRNAERWGVFRRIARFIRRSFLFRRAATALLIIVLITAVIIQNSSYSQGATYTWFQTSWAGGATANDANHESNQTGWTQYSSKDGFLSAGTDVALSLASTVSGQTSNAQFGTGTTSQTTVANDSVALESYGPVATSIISGGKYSACALSGSGAVYCWGINTYGELGSGTNNQSLTPVQVVKGAAASGDYSGAYLANIKTISLGFYYACAVSNNNNVYCWGYNSSGQLGDNDPGVSKNSPVRVLAGTAASGDYSGSYLANIKSVSTGDAATCAVSNNNNIYCWGDNANGRLGDGTINNRNTPIRVLAGAAASGDYSGSYLSNIKEVKTGSTHTCAVSNQDNPYCWGSNGLGKLGDGTTNNSNTPIRILAGAAASGDYSGTYLSNVRHISTGNSHTCAVSTQSNPYCWGSGNYGQLGNNSTNASNPSPVRVLMGEAAGTDNDTINLTNISNIATNLEGTQKNTCAYSGAGNAYCWGRYSYGQVGVNTTGGGNYLTPKRVLKGGADAGDNDGIYLNNIKNISIKGAFACAASNNDYAYCWGEAGSGQLGDNATIQRNTPVQVHGVGDSGYLSLATPITYAASGTFTSGVINTNYNVAAWGNLSWIATLNGQTIQMKARSCDDAACSGEDATKPFGGNTDADWDNVGDTCNTIASDSALSTGNCVDSGHQYLQYAARLKTADTSVTPTLDSVGYGYSRYFSEQFLYSSEYDTTDSGNVLSSIAWSETRPSNTDVQFQVRTSADGATWSNWCGPDNGTTGCATGTYFTDPAGGEAVDADFTDSTDDQWIQYKIRLTSATGQYAPAVSDVTMTYVVNAAPAISSVSASENSSGILNISYTLSDADYTTEESIYFAADVGATLADNPLSSGATTINLSGDYSNFPTGSQTIQIDQEQITCSSRSGAVLSSCSRAQNNSRAASHSQSSTVWFVGTGANIDVDTSDGDGSSTTVAEGSWSGTWDIKADLDGVYDATAQVRVAANDGQLANQVSLVSGATASDVVIDTKNPTGVSFTINNQTNALTIATPSDDSSYQMLVSNASNFSGASAQDFASPYTHSALTSDPATAYVRIIDAYGNYTDATATTPAKPANVLYYDISNAETSEWREFVTWGAISALQVGAGFDYYDIHRSSDGDNYASIYNESDRTMNYYTDTGLDSANTYYYKIQSVDTSGNTSEFSAVVSDQPNGQGSSDQTDPTITDVTVSDINTTSATVTWTTDELSDSSVGYSTNQTYLPERGIASMVTSHSVTLTGLNPGTSYYVRVKSRDAAGNLAQTDYDSPGNNQQADFTFDTNPGPSISNVAVASASNTQATITWTTDTDSSTYVVYSDTVSGGALVDPISIGTPDLVGGAAPFYHSQTITDLSEGSLYYFYVQSVDVSSNTATDDNGGNFYDLYTTADNVVPEISSISAAIRNNTQAAIHWVTDEQANSTVNYGTVSGNLNLSGSVATYDTSHYVILSSLSPNTTYYYTVTSADINGNEDTSAEYSFITLRNPEEQHDPISVISNISVPAATLTDTNAVVTFDTDQPGLCYIQSTTSQGDYGNPTVTTEDGYIAQTDFNSHHSIVISDLLFSTKYYYKIFCSDNLNTPEISSNENNFTTSAQLQTSSEWGAGQAAADTTAPTISGVSATGVTGESVIIKWDTNENASSYVRYGTTTDYGSMAGNDLVNADSANYATSHAVTVNNLIPSTKYYLTAISIDTAGNIAESAEKTFTTKSPSGITSVKVESKALGEAVFTWNTSTDMTSIVDYGLNTTYTESKENTAKTKAHEISISGLLSGQTYHFRVKGKDADNNLYSSNDYTFEPKSPPRISGIRVESISEHSAKVLFETNVPTDALVTYSDPLDDKNSGSKGTPEMATNHEVELLNLSPGTAYKLTVKVKDEQGNETEDAEESFTTGKDENPPAIDKVKTDTALTQGDKVQAIISWETNEPATANIIYKEGKNGEEKSVLVDETHVLGHIAVVTAFKSGTVYYFKVKALDKAGNEAVSGEYAVLTPKRKENIIQVITNTFQDVFSWARF